MALTCIIYARISRDREGREYGVDRQQEACRRLAERNGWTVADLIIDNDMSASNGKRRPGYDRLLNVISTGNVDAVVALSPTRLYRRLREGLGFLDLIAERGTLVATVNQGTYNLATAEGRRDARRAAVDGQAEVELISERVRDSKRQAAEQGRWRGGNRPFGFERDGVTVRETEAEAIRAGCDAILAGASLGSVAESWNKLGLTTPARRKTLPDGTKTEPASRQWTRTEVKRCLLRGRNAGLIVSKGEVVGEADWPAVVDRSTWEAVTVVLTDPRRRTTPGPERVGLISGMATCWCGQHVRRGTCGPRKEPAYRCATTAHVARNAHAVDNYITIAVVERLSRADALDLLTCDEGPDIAELSSRATALRVRLDDLAGMLGRGELDSRQFKIASDEARGMLDAVQQQLADAARTPAVAGIIGMEDVQATWDALDLARRRAVIDALIESIVIMEAKKGRPAGRKRKREPDEPPYLDTSKIEIIWRQ